MASDDEQEKLTQNTEHTAATSTMTHPSMPANLGDEGNDQEQQQRFQNNSTHQVEFSAELLHDLLTAEEMARALNLEDEKLWTTMDSIHSRSSAIPLPMSLQNPASCGAAAAMSEQQGHGSMGDFDDSCCSFASFGGGSDSDLNDSGNDLSTQRAAFTRLTEDPSPRRVLLAKATSVRMKRGVSFRNSNLTLIDESNSLD